MNRTRAFSLIELMVVVAILSITAAILVPRFLKHQQQLQPSPAVKNSGPTESNNTRF